MISDLTFLLPRSSFFSLSCLTFLISSIFFHFYDFYLSSKLCFMQNKIVQCDAAVGTTRHTSWASSIKSARRHLRKIANYVSVLLRHTWLREINWGSGTSSRHHHCNTVILQDWYTEICFQEDTCRELAPSCSIHLSIPWRISWRPSIKCSEKTVKFLGDYHSESGTS